MKRPLADLQEALLLVFEEDGVPDELAITVDAACDATRALIAR